MPLYTTEDYVQVEVNFTEGMDTVLVNKLLEAGITEVGQEDIEGNLRPESDDLVLSETRIFEYSDGEESFYTFAYDGKFHFFGDGEVLDEFLKDLDESAYEYV